MKIFAESWLWGHNFKVLHYNCIWSSSIIWATYDSLYKCSNILWADCWRSPRLRFFVMAGLIWAKNAPDCRSWHISWFFNCSGSQMHMMWQIKYLLSFRSIPFSIGLMRRCGRGHSVECRTRQNAKHEIPSMLSTRTSTLPSKHMNLLPGLLTYVENSPVMPSGPHNSCIHMRHAY